MFGERLLFPPAFVGRGDMSRGGLLLRCVDAGQELDYVPVAGAVRHGPRPPPPGATPAPAAAHAAGAPPGASRPRRRPVPQSPSRATSTTSRCGAGRATVRLTNLRKPFWPELGITKGDLLQYYADVAPALLPHLRDRAMVMKRYPHGVAGEFFFMKRAPSPRPDWIEICSIEHDSGQRHRLPDDPGPARRCCG